MILEELAELLSDETTAWTYDPDGTTGNIFLGYMPDEPDLALMLKLTGGDGNDTKLGYDTPTVQAMTRGGTLYDRTAGYDEAREVYDVLAGLTSKTLPAGTWLILARAAQSEPSDIGQDEKGRQEWSQNFILEVRAVTANRE